MKITLTTGGGKDMNKLKRLLTLLVSICLIFSLAGCFNSEADRKKIVEPIVTQSIHTMCDILKQFDNMRQIPNNTNQETFQDLIGYEKECDEVEPLWETQEDLGPVEIYDDSWKLIKSINDE